MIKKCKESIKNFGTFLAGDPPQCYETTETVVDSAKTSSNREACRLEKQAVLDEIDLEIEEYTTLQTSLTDKMTEATTLSENLGKGKELIENANINYDSKPCTECVSNLISSFETMLSDCETKLEELTEKRRYAKLSLDGCATDTSLIAYKEVKVTHCS